MPLTTDEIHVLNSVGFDADVFESIRRESDKPIERLLVVDPVTSNRQPGLGISWAVADGDEAEQLMGVVGSLLTSRGYRAYWSVRHDPSGMRETDELAVVKTTEPFAMLRLRATDGANYDISTDDIIDRLLAWQKFCAFDVVGASRDWVAIVFSRLPDRICAFAEDVYVFCPDSVEQGVGLFRSEEREPEAFADARRLCPDISDAIRREKDETLARAMKVLPLDAIEQFKTLFQGDKGSQETEMGIRFLAQDILKRKYLFLWWD